MWGWKPVSTGLKNLKYVLCFERGRGALSVEMEVGLRLAREASNASIYCDSLWLHGAKPLLTKQDNAPQRERPPVQQCQLNCLHVTALRVEAKDPTTFSSSSLSGLIFQPINPQAGLLCGAEAAVLIMLKRVWLGWEVARRAVTLFQGAGTSCPPLCIPSWPEIHKSKTPSAFVYVCCLCWSRLPPDCSFLIAVTLSDKGMSFLSPKVVTPSVRPASQCLLPVQFITLWEQKNQNNLCW